MQYVKLVGSKLNAIKVDWSNVCWPNAWFNPGHVLSKFKILVGPACSIYSSVTRNFSETCIPMYEFASAELHPKYSTATSQLYFKIPFGLSWLDDFANSIVVK